MKQGRRPTIPLPSLLRMMFRRNTSLFSSRSLVLAALVLAAPLHGDPTLPVIPKAVFKATDYGAVGDGSTNNTAALQSAIATARAAGGGTVELPPAVAAYLSGPLTLYSNIALQVDAGATLQALPFGPYGSGAAHFITINTNSTNVALTGGGTIDGNGAGWWTAFAANSALTRPRLVQVNRATAVLVSGLTLSNSPSFHLAFNTTDHVTIDGVTISAPSTAPNSDGIDPAGSHYLIRNCSISVGDDNIAFKAGSVLCTDLTVTGCTFGTGHGLSIGGQTNAGLDGLTVTNCTFTGTTSGLRLKADPTQGGLVQNLSYSNLTMTNVQYPIVFYSYYDQVGNPGSTSGSTQTTPAKVKAWNATPPNSAYSNYATATLPVWRNISITNLTATRSGSAPNGYGIVWGLPNRPIFDLTLTDVRLIGYAGMEFFNAQNVRLTGRTSFSGSLVSYNAQVISLQPTAQAASAGGNVNLFAGAVTTSAAGGVVVTGYQWNFNGQLLIDGPRLDGAIVSGAATPILTLRGVQAAEAGNYTVTRSTALDTYVTALVPGGNVATTSSNAAALTVVSTADVGRLVNLSTRANVGTGDNILIAGFVLGGAGNDGSAKRLLVRGAGPALTRFEVPGVLTDPVLQVVNPNTGVPVAGNDNWAGDPTVAGVASQVGAFPLTDPASLDAALITSLTPASYTAAISGKGGGTGIALVELYDATVTSSTAPRLINLSSRAAVTDGAGNLIVGFVIGGSTPRTLLIRGIGPGLAQFNLGSVLADPVLQVYRTDTGAPVAVNDNWWGDATVSLVASRVGAFTLADPASRDAALLVTLPPGAYTANLSGGAGVGLVELYDVP